jgi:rhodanese-related sulfurtransferase
MIRLFTALYCVIATTSCSFSIDFPIVTSKSDVVEDSYCGLYCVFHAARITNRPIGMENLLNSKRLNGKFGSSTKDLVDCCHDFDIPHKYLSSASFSDLLIIECPSIVLLKSSPDSKLASHWVMVFDVYPHKCKIYDPSTGVMDVSAAEFQSLWSGIAIIILTDNSDTIIPLWHGVRVALILFSAAAVYSLLRLIGKYKSGILFILGAATLALIAATQLLNPSSILHNPGVVAQMNAAAYPREVPEITSQELLANPHMYIVVDVRTEIQYLSQHIAGSINIPITTPYWKCRDLYAGYPSETSFVLYCNSKSCGWAEVVAKSAVLHKHSRVFVLHDGLNGYLEAGGL